MVVFFVIAVPLTNGGSVNFLTIRNSQNILVAITPILLLGLGQTFVIISAGIDLSVGWVMSLCLGALGARHPRGLQCRACRSSPPPSSASSPPSPAPALVGFINGVIIAKLKVPAFIVTLGTSFIVRGVALLMAENTTVIGLPAGHPRLRQRGARSISSAARAAGSTSSRRPRSPARCSAAWTASCPIR